MPMSANTLDQFARTFRDTIERLYARSGAGGWNLSLGGFSVAFLWKMPKNSIKICKDGLEWLLG